MTPSRSTFSEPPIRARNFLLKPLLSCMELPPEETVILTSIFPELALIVVLWCHISESPIISDRFDNSLIQIDLVFFTASR